MQLNYGLKKEVRNKDMEPRVLKLNYEALEDVVLSKEHDLMQNVCFPVWPLRLEFIFILFFVFDHSS